MTTKPATCEEWEEYADKLKIILSKERATRRAAESDAKKFKAKFYEARDSSELWQHRARKNLELLNALSNNTNQTVKD